MSTLPFPYEFLAKASLKHLVEARAHFFKTVLLLIRPKRPDDPVTTQFHYPAAAEILQVATSLGWRVIDVPGNQANRANVEQLILAEDPNFIIHYDHGNSWAKGRR